MKYPELVPDCVCRTDISLIIYTEGISEDGEPLTAFEFTGRCNWQNGAETRLTADKRLVTISGKASMNGDICPDISDISDGIVKVFGNEYRIFRGFKARNPDGTVNFTHIEVI